MNVSVLQIALSAQFQTVLFYSWLCVLSLSRDITALAVCTEAPPSAVQIVLLARGSQSERHRICRISLAYIRLHDIVILLLSRE